MTVYQYVAQNDPAGAIRVINSFGYEVADNRDLGVSLRELVSNVGEPALRKVMELHPEKDLILELNSDPKESKCSCGNCNNQSKSKVQEHFYNASGSETPPAPKNDVIAHQTNVILVVATLFIVTALIYKK